MNANINTTDAEATRNVFNEQIAAELASQNPNQDRIAKLELMREYFTNSSFRSEMEQMVYQLTK